MMKAILFWLCLYLVIMLFAFVSEITYKKKTIKEVRQNFKRVVIETALTFAVFVVASYLWSKFGSSG